MTYSEWEKKWGVSPSCYSEVGVGWVPLLDDLATALAAVSFDFALVSQVKEKFGGLRFYIDTHDPEAGLLIDAAEAASLKTCEDCGEPGKPRAGGWVKTLCEKCWDAR